MSASQILRQAVLLATQQRIDEAVNCLRDGIRAAKDLGDRDAISRLARASAVLCGNNGRLREAAAYYEEAAQVDDGDAYVQWALGDVYADLGDDDRSKCHWQRFVEIASASSDSGLLEFLRTHLTRTGDKGEPDT